jgi:hypothetical protein
LARGGDLIQIADSDRLLESAVEHRMLGLLWSYLSQHSNLGEPQWRRTVAAHDLVNQRRNASHWDGLGLLADLARDLGVEVATPKGVAAEARWYDRMGERPCGDVDLFLAPGDLERVDEVVAAIEPGHPLIGHLRPLIDRRILQSVDLTLGEKHAVDLHFDLLKLGVPSRSPERVWAHMVPYRAPNRVRLLVPDPELSLVHFLLHMTKDRFRQLLGYVDVVRVIEREEIDWDEVVGLASDQGLEEHLRLALEAVGEVVPIPAAPALRPRGGITRTVWAIFWRPGVRLRGWEALVRFRHRQDWIALTARGRFPEALRFWVRRRLLPPRELLTYRHPGGGSYWWQVTFGRLGASLRRRRALGPLGRRGSLARGRDGDTSRADARRSPRR